MLRYACIVPFASPEDGPEMPPLPPPFDKWEVLQAEGSVYPPAPESTCIVTVGSERAERAALDALEMSAASGEVIVPDLSHEAEMRAALPALESLVTVLGPVEW